MKNAPETAVLAKMENGPREHRCATNEKRGRVVPAPSCF
jgi:hypothetical protein